MPPLLRLWAACAACLAVFFALRGAWAAALACFFLSPAPVWVFAHGRSGQSRLSTTWLVAIAIGFALVAALYVAIVSQGGLPPVHEWRAALVGRP